MRKAMILAIWLVAALVPLDARSQEAADPAASRTFKALLFLVPGESASGLRVEHLKEVWSEGDSAERLRAHLASAAAEQLQVLTVTPGQDAGVVQYKDLTFRINGLYKGAQKDRMFLRVSFDQAGRAAVKEFLAGLNESVLVAYPLVGDAQGSIVAVLIPVG